MDVRDPDADPTARDAAARHNGSPGSSSTPDGHPERALQDALRDLIEIRDRLIQICAVRADLLRLKVIGLLGWVVVGVLATAAAITVAVACVVKSIEGIAGALAELSGRQWMGDGLAALSILILLALAGVLVRRRIIVGSFTRTVERHARRTQDQRP